MADRIVPLSVQERHKLLFIEKTAPADLVEWGRAHLGKGLLHDALEYFEKAGDLAMLGEVRKRAVDEADLVLYQNALRAMKAEPDREELFRLGERARAMGKDSVSEATVSLLVVSGETGTK